MNGLFPLGKIVATRAATLTLQPEEIRAALCRHAQGDWGDIDPMNWESNEQALRVSDRLLSVYHTGNGVTFWVITEWDRSITTILLPQDY
jgi:hypothetical protein